MGDSKEKYGNRNDPNWRSGSFYGRTEASKLRSQLLGFSPAFDGVEESNLEVKDMLLEFGRDYFDSFLDALAALINDSSMSFCEKAKEFMDWFVDEADAAEYFRELWTQLADGRPYPLDESGSTPGSTGEKK